MNIQPYLFLEGRSEEAIAFYQAALGAEVDMLMRFGDHPAPGTMAMSPPADRVMHARLRIGDAVVLLSDGRCGGAPSFEGFALSLTTSDIDDAKRKFAALAEGGAVRMPLDETFFSPCFGMVTDRFGVLWMVYVGA
ncbi:MAG TPA: VOC family protein [Acidisphaera sp.]|nr:VOC family protein [Acidisphaera sp.]